MSASNPFFATYQTFGESRFFWSLFELKENWRQNKRVSIFLPKIWILFWCSLLHVGWADKKFWKLHLDHFPPKSIIFRPKGSISSHDTARHHEAAEHIWRSFLIFFASFDFFYLFEHSSLFRLSFTFHFFHLLEHLSSLEFSSEPLKQSETPSQSLLILKICRTSAVSFTWQPKKPSSRFTKKTSFPLPPENCEFTLVHVNTEDHRSIRTRHSILAWNRKKIINDWNKRCYYLWLMCER